MTRFRLDYDLTQHPEIKRIGEAAAWAYIQSVLYCNHYDSAVIPRDIAESTTDGGSYLRLAEAGLWKTDGDVVVVADPVTFCSQETRERTQATIRKRRQRERDLSRERDMLCDISRDKSRDLSREMSHSSVTSHGSLVRGRVGAPASPVQGDNSKDIDIYKTTTTTVAGRTSVPVSVNGAQSPHGPPSPSFDPQTYETILGDKSVKALAELWQKNANPQLDEAWLRSSLREAATACGDIKTREELGAALSKAGQHIERSFKIQPNKRGFVESPRPWARTVVVAKIRGDP